MGIHQFIGQAFSLVFVILVIPPKILQKTFWQRAALSDSHKVLPLRVARQKSHAMA